VLTPVLSAAKHHSGIAEYLLSDMHFCMDWNHYASFRAVMRQGSLSAAEGTLAVALFTRSPQGLTPTSAAFDLLPRVEEMNAAAEAAARAISGGPEGESGVVRITASEIIGGVVLPPILADFRERHPGIVVELVLTNRNEDLLRRDADIAVRMIRPQQSALVARRIGAIGIGLFAHRRYAQAHGLPQSIAEIADHPLIGFDRDEVSLRAMAAEIPFIGRARFAFRSDSDLAQLAALRGGFGLGGCQLGIAADEPDLVPVLPDQVRFELEMWLAMHEDQRPVARVRTMYDHLAVALGDYARRR